MNYLRVTCWLAWAALLMVTAPEAGAVDIFLDDYSPDQNPLTTADIGTYDASSSAVATSGFLQTFGPAGQVKAAGLATQTSTAGTQLVFEWDWNLLGNDTPGTTYNPIAGLAFNADDRALGIRVIYAGQVPELTSASVFFEQAGGGFADSGLDVPVGTGFRHWRLDYTVGNAVATLNVDGVAALTNVAIPVAFPAQNVVGPWFLGSGFTDSRFDNAVLRVVPEPTSISLMGLGVCLALVLSRRGVRGDE